MLQRLLILAALAVLLPACQTSMLKSFESVRPGMDKHQVLEALGSPTATTRMRGKDRWIYRFYDDGIRFEKEVHFLSGTVVHIGDTWEPPAERSAEGVDRRAAELEEKIQAEHEAREEARKNNAEAYAEFERRSRNRQDVKYMPQFIEVK